MAYKDPVNVNVGGTIYACKMNTLNKFRGSHIVDRRKEWDPYYPFDSKKNEFFFDRDGQIFRHILNYLRTNKLILPKNFPEMDLLLEEATFYGLKDLCEIIINKSNEESGFESLPVPNTNTSNTSETTINESKIIKKRRRRYGRNLNIRNQKRADEVNNGKSSTITLDVDSDSCVEQTPEVKSDVQENGLTNRNINLDCEIICITTLTNGAVDEVWSSSTLPDIDNFPETSLVEKLKAAKCDELGDFLFSTSMFFSGYTKCPKCSEQSKWKYVWNGKDIGCERCVRTSEINTSSLKDEKCMKESRVTVGFPWLAKYFMKMGYKLISTCASQNSSLIYHYFVK